MVELCAKIPQIMCSIFEDYTYSFWQLCVNYTQHFLGYLLHILLSKA